MQEYLDKKIIGQQNILANLKESAGSANLGHAYLFGGSKDLGKRKVAKDFIARILGLENFDDKNQDLLWFGVQEDKKDIIIEQVKQLQQFLSLSSYSGGYRVAVIDQAEKMNREATNCLLKTLEEPPKNVVLILITESLDGLLDTIISRCQLIRFYPVAIDKIKTSLSEIYPDITKPKINHIVQLSQGKPELALRLAGDDNFLQTYEKKLMGLISISLTSVGSRFAWIDKRFKKTSYNETKAIVEDMLDYLSIAFHWAVNLEMNTFDRAEVNFSGELLDKFLKKYDIDKCGLVFEEILQAKSNMQAGTNPKLVLQNLCLNI